MASFKVAAYQMRVCEDPRANFAKVEAGIRAAASAGAKLIALPECAISGYPPLHYAKAFDINIRLIHRLNDEVTRLARESGIWVVVGTITGKPGGLLNSALVISANGELVGRYDKMHLMPLDRHYFAPGRSVRPFRAGNKLIGVQICYDVRFPEGFRYLREQGARLMVIILNACGGDAWKLPVLEGAFRTRAAENTAFVVAVNAAGPLQMATSRICDPRGLDLASADVDREEMLFADIDLAQAETGIFDDRRTDLFEAKALFEGEC
jgi:omega-amidase